MLKLKQMLWDNRIRFEKLEYLHASQNASWTIQKIEKKKIKSSTD